MGSTEDARRTGGVWRGRRHRVAGEAGVGDPKARSTGT